MAQTARRLDARGLNRLQRNGTLPTVWIPPGELRDQRELPRTRMVLVRPAHPNRYGEGQPKQAQPVTGAHRGRGGSPVRSR
jgi:hypothetical protein